MMFLLGLAAAALNDVQRTDIRCVAVLAVEAARPGGTPGIAASGRGYAAVVGAALIDDTGRTREEVAALLRDAAVALRARPAAVAEVARCRAAMGAALAAAPLPEPAR